MCQFTIDISNNSPFTGLFKAGETVSGLIRMGSAQDFGLVPGVSVKMLRTGTKSANLLALYILDPLPNNNYNFFSVPLSNLIVNKPEGLAAKVVGKRFCYATGTQKFSYYNKYFNFHVSLSVRMSFYTYIISSLFYDLIF